MISKLSPIDLLENLFNKMPDTVTPTIIDNNHYIEYNCNAIESIKQSNFILESHIKNGETNHYSVSSFIRKLQLHIGYNLESK